MGTQLATIETMDNEAIARMMGLGSTPAEDRPAKLAINYSLQDKDGNRLEKGVFRLYNGTEVVYGKDLSLRILGATHQINEYDEESQTYVNETVFFDYGGDKHPEDRLGGYRCGKLFSKDMKDAPKALKAEQRAKKFNKVLFGLATLHGTNGNGDEAVAENIVCMMYVKGSAFKEVSDYVQSFSKDDPSWAWSTNFDIESAVNGSVEYYILHPKRGEKLTVDKDVLMTMVAVKEWKESYNEDVLRDYRKANGFVDPESLKTVGGAEPQLAAVLHDEEEEPPFDVV